MIPSLLGYIASVLLGISLIINNDLKFRWLNTLGCLCFTIYGVLIHAFPIILTNTVLLLINLYSLLKIYRTEEDFDLVEFKEGDKLVNKFLNFHHQDIEAYFPAYKPDQATNNLSFVVLRDMVIANVFVASLSHDGIATVKINYTVPKYRDYKVGRFIFNKENKYLVSRGVKSLLYNDIYNPQHMKFLEIMGFHKSVVKNSMVYIKQLN